MPQEFSSQSSCCSFTCFAVLKNQDENVSALVLKGAGTNTKNLQKEKIQISPKPEKDQPHQMKVIKK